MMRPKSRGVVPPGGECVYIDPDTKHRIAHPYYNKVKSDAHAHRVAMNLTIPSDWDWWFDQEYCKSTPQACYELPDKPSEFEQSKLRMAKDFALAMIRWAKAGFRFVPYETFKYRYEKCTGTSTQPRCQFFTTFPVFGLTRCGKCGCSSVKLYLPSEKCPVKKW